MAEVLPPNALTTVARVKDRLTITGVAHESVLLRLIAEVTDFIEGQCNKSFLRQSHTELLSFRIQQPDMVFLKQRPVASITSFKWRQGLYNDPNYTDIPATDYVLEGGGESGIVKVDGGWLQEGFNVAQIVYQAGFLISFDDLGDISKHNLPGDITDLCERLVTKEFKQREDEGKESVSTAMHGSGGTPKWLNHLTDVDLLIIQKHTITPAFI